MGYREIDEMVRIELLIDSNNCIETASRRRYDSYTREYFLKPTDDLEEKIDLLHRFLISADFREIRRESERYIIQGKAVKFVIYLEDDRAKYRLETGWDSGEGRNRSEFLRNAGAYGENEAGQNRKMVHEQATSR